jgi:hypothetical protein
MKAVLLVTWIVAGQPPASYHVEFDTIEKCHRARQAVLADYDRMHNINPFERNSVSAVCVGR